MQRVGLPWLGDLTLPLVSTAGLVGLEQARGLPGHSQLQPMLVFLLLVIGSWRGLVLLGYVADALGAPVDEGTRARILNDRFVGSFGVCAIAVSVVTQLAAAISAEGPTRFLATAPTLAAFLGVLCGSSVEKQALMPRSLAMLALFALTTFVTALRGSGVAPIAAALVGLLVAWRLVSYARHGTAVAGTVAGHLSLLTMLVLERL